MIIFLGFQIIVIRKECGDKIIFSKRLGRLLFKYTGVKSHILKLVTVSLMKLLRWKIERRRFFLKLVGIHRHRLIDKFLVDLTAFDDFIRLFFQAFQKVVFETYLAFGFDWYRESLLKISYRIIRVIALKRLETCHLFNLVSKTNPVIKSVFRLKWRKILLRRFVAKWEYRIAALLSNLSFIFRCLLREVVYRSIGFEAAHRCFPILIIDDIDVGGCRFG